MDDDLSTQLSDFEKYYHDEDPLHAWHHFPRLIALSCLLLFGLLIFPSLYMHRLTEVPVEAVTDTTGSLYTGGIIWRLTCFVCLILLVIIGFASLVTLEIHGVAFLLALWTVEIIVGVVVYAAVSSEPTSETDKGCEGDLCLSNAMFECSLLALIDFADVAFVFGAFLWSDEHDGWGLRREILGLRDLVRSGWQNL